MKIGNISIGNDKPLAVMAGPCAMESLDHALFMAEHLKNISVKFDIPLIYKSSFDKANRTSAHADRGIGLEHAMTIFDRIKADFELPVMTDIHLPEQCAQVAPHIDVIQIPAFLCRQTDLLAAAAATDCAINIKKGQFLAPWDMKNVVEKVRAFGSNRVMACERGASFGYNTLVTDFRGLSIMKDECACPVVFDATHSVQQPGGQGSKSGGQRQFAPLLARAAVSVGVAAVFMETHQDPDQAPSDGPNMIPLHRLSEVLEDLQQFDQLAKSKPIPDLLQNS